jgi:hypothetical protein
MCSQLSMEGETITDGCKPLGTHITLHLDSRIDEPKSMEGDTLKGNN